MPSDPVAIAIIRSIRPDQVKAFEAALRDWIPRSLEFPGHAGVLIVRPPEGGHEYGAFLRFADAEAWTRFQRWPDYLAFLDHIRPMLAHDPSTKVSRGLESWVDAGHSGKPIRWRLALVTWVSVCVLVYLAQHAVAAISSLGPAWPHWLAFLITNALVVSGLAWVVMPPLTRVLHMWLHGKERRS